MTSTVAGLPKYVVLKSKSTGKYLHYLWNDEFSDYYKHMGSKRDLDPVNPFVKLEVVPSTSDPTLVHLICSYNNKFIQLVTNGGVSWLSATADSADEDRTKETSTLFQPIFPADEPNTVEFLHVQTDRNVRLFVNKDYDDKINNVACAYSKDGGSAINRFEFAAWVSYEEVIKAKDDEIEKLKAQAAAAGGDDDESLSADAIVEELRKDIREQNDQLEAAYNEIDALKAAAKGN